MPKRVKNRMHIDIETPDITAEAEEDTVTLISVPEPIEFLRDGAA